MSRHCPTCGTLDPVEDREVDGLHREVAHLEIVRDNLKADLEGALAKVEDLEARILRLVVQRDEAVAALANIWFPVDSDEERARQVLERLGVP